MACLDGKACDLRVPSKTKMMKAWFSKRYDARSDWIRNHIVFTKPLLFIWGLVLSHSIVEYAVACILMLYLVDFIGQSLLVAAIILNLLHSVSGLLVFLVAYIAEAYTDRFNVIVFSTGSYTMGLILQWITASSDVEFDKFYIAIILIAIGNSGRGSILQSFLGFQLRERKDASEIINVPENEVNIGEQREREVGPKIWWLSARISGYVIALFAFGNATWLAVFKISALVMGGTCFIFYSGFFCYNKEKPTRKSLAKILKVFKAATSKRFLWVAFFPYSLVWATANTLFIVQINYTYMHIGKRELLRAIFFLVLKSIISDIVVFIFWFRKSTRKRIQLVRIGAGMIFALFSCIAARQVELHQQHSIGPISTLWLVPQYFLLGLMEGFSGGGLDAFFYARVPKSMKSFAEPFSELVLCVGKFSNILFLLIFSPWFGHHSYDGHMDRYFLMLAIVCSVFFCFYLVSSLGYDNSETSSEMEESVAMEAGIETPEGDQRLRHDDQEEDEAEPQIEIIDCNEDTS